MNRRLPSLSIGNQRLAMQWHPFLNGKIDPRDVSLGSRIGIWWRCDVCENDWKASVKNRNRGNGCPFCSGNRTSVLNCLKIKSPRISGEWNLIRNGVLDPANISFGSKNKVWWKCKNGHEWKASVNDRSNGSNCPYCSGNKTGPDNCLSVVCARISQEWHPSKNGSLRPDGVTGQSNKKVWWKCKNGHEWKAVIANRRNGSDCPFCSGCGISNIEVRVFTELERIFVGVRHSERIRGKEIDIFLPDIKLGIEVDGHYWHKNREGKDIEKAEFFKSLGIRIIRFREFPLRRLGESDVIYNQNELRSAIEDLVDLISIEKGEDHSWYRVGSDFIGNDGYLRHLASTYPKEHRSLKRLFPIVAAEWHSSKNGPLTPENVSFGSNKKVWWRCVAGHEWQANVLHRSYGSGCPYCSGNKTSSKNCLTTRSPSLSVEWHPSKNNGISTDTIAAFSNKKAWWKCVNGHEWMAVVADRMRGSKCPVCH